MADKTSECLEGIEQLIRDHEASNDLVELVDDGCNRRRLLLYLDFLRNPYRDFQDDWETFFGVGDRKTAQRTAERFRGIADEIERINDRGLFSWWLRLTDPKLRKFIELPNLIRRYSQILEAPSKIKPKKQHPIFNAVQATLVKYVKLKTGRSHDRQVSALISAVLDKSYTEDDLRSWRHQHKDFIQRAHPSD